MKGNPVILFDGVCNLCNGIVKFIIKNDPESYFRFTPLQSPTGQSLLEKHGFNREVIDTFVLINEDTCLTKSDAALYIVRCLPGLLWSLLGIFSIIPKPIRNWGYDMVVRNRYRWFGKKEECLVPTNDILNRFLD